MNAQHPAQHPKLSSNAREALLTAVYEYLLVTLPVGMYVGFEALHEANPYFLATSPEWLIATIFLSFQGSLLYQENLKGVGKIVNPIVGLLGLISLSITVIASIVAYKSIEQDSQVLAIVRVLLFVVSSVAFVLLVSGARFVRLTAEARRNVTPAGG